jgi:hypothetical protein
MIDDAGKIAILNKIISSKTFCNADQYIELLKFLVHSEINRIPVKEYAIGVEILKKGKAFNPAIDPSVRIYIHRLRNKIKAYYDEEGKTDRIVLTIPKGHYEVRFDQRSFVKRSLLQRLSSKHVIIFGIVMALAVANILTYYHYQSIQKSYQAIRNPIPKDDPIWSHFFSNQLPTTIVIGDHFQFWEFDEAMQKSRIIIDYGVADQAAFEQFSRQFPNRQVKKERHGGLPVNSAWNIYDLTHVLYSFDQPADIELSSLFAATQFDLKNIIDRNVIYIGGFSGLREFSTILAKLPIEYKYTDNFKGIVTVRAPESDSLIHFVGKKLDNQYHQDVGLIAKIAGSNNENYLFLVGFAFPSQIENVRLLSRPDQLSKLYAQTVGDKMLFPKHFIVILEILCTEFSAIDTKVKYFREIPSTAPRQ